MKGRIFKLWLDSLSGYDDSSTDRSLMRRLSASEPFSLTNVKERWMNKIEEEI